MGVRGVMLEVEMAGKVDYKTAKTTSNKTAKYKPNFSTAKTKMGGSKERAKGRTTKMNGS